MNRVSKTMFNLGVAAAILASLESTSQAAYDTINPLSYNRLCPTKIAGDSEYGGHGPEVTTFIGLGRYNNNQIWLQAKMHQRETVSDWSEANLDRWFKITERFDGTNYTHIWADTGGGYTWVSLPNGTYWDTFNDFYVDTSHSTRTVIPGAKWLSSVITNGDTSGNDIGNCTADDAYLTVNTPTLYFLYQ